MSSSPGNSPAKKPRFYYGWLIVWLSFATLGFHVVTRFSFGIFQVPLLEEFGWSRGLLSGAFSLSMATYAIGAPFAGSLLEKKGPRAIMPWGSVILGLTFISCFFVSSLWHLYILFGLFAGYGLSLSGFSTHSAIIPRWFVRKRGRATGIALSGIGIGILVLAPLIERLIASVGWRYTYMIFGLVLLCVVAPAAFVLLRDVPEDVGQGPDGGPPRTPEEMARAGVGHGGEGKGVWEVFTVVKRDIRFWCLLLMVFAIGLNNNTIMSQLQLYLVDVGYGTALAAVIFGSVGFIRTFGSIGGGWVGDIIGRGRGGGACGRGGGGGPDAADPHSPFRRGHPAGLRLRTGLRGRHRRHERMLLRPGGGLLRGPHLRRHHRLHGDLLRPRRRRRRPVRGLHVRLHEKLPHSLPDDHRLHVRLVSPRALAAGLHEKTRLGADVGGRPFRLH